jgi:hypothetical protein
MGDTIWERVKDSELLALMKTEQESLEAHEKQALECMKRINEMAKVLIQRNLQLLED